MNHANYEIVKVTDDFVLIRDLGPWDKHPTITNDAEAVVEKLGWVLQRRRLLYYDSEGDMDEIIVKDGKFAGFAVLPRPCLLRSAFGRTQWNLSPLVHPLEGAEVIRWFSTLGEVQSWLASLLSRGALVCTSPNREVRCDTPATKIFWQDSLEWYPCCSGHFPAGEQWTGNTRFRPRFVGVLLFRERASGEDIGAEKFQEYDRTNAA